MTVNDYIAEIRKTFTLVSVLSSKNGCRVMRMRHNKLGRDMVVRCFGTAVPAYEVLCGIRFPALPETYESKYLADGQVVLEEYIDGMTVAQVMECVRYTYRGARAVMSEVCDALTVLHTHGLVHRDVKPENVMVDGCGRVVLLDLNASRISSDKPRDTVVMGTVGYASPEQLGVASSDSRTDIYAAGVMLNVMLTGKHPSEKLARGKAGRIVRKCTAVNPSDRYKTAEKLKEAL